MAVEKCPVCGKEFKALRLHMPKHKVAGKEDMQKGVSVEEFEEYKKSVGASLDKFSEILTDAVTQLLQRNTEQPGQESIGPIPEQPLKDYGIPPEHEVVFSKYFDRDDGFDAKIDILENTFTVIVPAKFSNASPAHKDFYTVDRRMVKMENNNPVGSVEIWCQKVAKNLRYDKNLKTK